MMDMLHILMPYGDKRSLLLFFYYVLFKLIEITFIFVKE